MDPVAIDGIPCYAPDSAYLNDGFPPALFQRLVDAEVRNFWYRSRARILRRQILRRLPGASEFLEVGCGTGSVLEVLSRGTELRLTGAEAYLDGLKNARARLPRASFVQLDACNLPYRDRFDGVGLFDVLEHIDDDRAALRSAWAALRPGGWIFATAPQHPFLWSLNDEVAFHRRRYARGELAERIRGAGFSVERETSFVTTLFPLMALARLCKRKSEADPYDAVLKELELPGPVNAALGAAMRIDEALIATGLKLPFGGSVLVVGRRPQG